MSKGRKKSERNVANLNDTNGKLTSYDYEKHCFTLDEETVNYWKDVKDTCKQLKGSGIDISRRGSFLETALFLHNYVRESRNTREDKQIEIEGLKASLRASNALNELQKKLAKYQ